MDVQKVQHTAGAVPVRNEKGELRMEKVKVTRYISGKRPAYAQEESSSESSSEEEEEERVSVRELTNDNINEENRRRLLESESEEEEEGEGEWEGLTSFPEVKEEGLRDFPEGEEEEAEINPERDVEVVERKEEDKNEERHYVIIESDKESEAEDEDDEEVDKRRELMRQKAKQRQEEELLAVTEEEDVVKKEEESEEESSEYEEYSDSDNDLTGPRLKPVFVKKMERVTIKDSELLEKEELKREKEHKIAEEKRKKESSRLLQQAITEDMQQEQGVDTLDEVIDTDDENEEEQYEAWKLRELKRIKRDREEMEEQRREREELERVRNMSEEDKAAWLKANPRKVVNEQERGTYKFLQKYYHRGVFYLDEEDEVFKRNFAEPTLEDHFDKSVLPAVMQVKNFGKAGRTKYTHLVDQDTTTLENPWSESTPINLNFQSKGGGARENFTKPSRKRQKTEN